jgi:hypothetical protein
MRGEKFKREDICPGTSPKMREGSGVAKENFECYTLTRDKRQQLV